MPNTGLSSWELGAPTAEYFQGLANDHQRTHDHPATLDERQALANEELQSAHEKLETAKEGR